MEFEAEDIESSFRLSPRPDVHDHEEQSLTEDHHPSEVTQEREDSHGETEHPHEISGGASSSRVEGHTLISHAVLIESHEMHQKREAEVASEEEGSH